MRSSAHGSHKGWTTVASRRLIAVPLRAEIIEQVLVKVNGDIITKTDLEARQIAAIRQQMNSRVDADALKNDAELRKTLLAITPQILVDTIDELLMIQIGKEKGYRLSDDQFKSWLENLRKEQNLQDDQKFQAALKQEGMTIDDLRKNVERQFLRSRVQQDEIGSKVSITEEEARQYYLSHKDEFAEAATVTLREIFVEIPTTTQKGQTGVNVGDDDETAKKAEAIRARVAAGEDFAKLATEVSDSPSKANGGLIGPLPVSDLSDALRQTIAAMKPGEVTQAGAHGQGIPDPEARDTEAGRLAAVRERAGPRRGPCLRRAPGRGAAQVLRAHPRPRDHRVEEPGLEEAVRTGHRRARHSIQLTSPCHTVQYRPGSPSGRGLVTSRPFGNNWNARASTPSFPRSRSGAAGRTARKRSTGRCSRVTASRASIRVDRLAVLKCAGVVSIVSFNGEIAPIPDVQIDGIRTLVESDLQYDPCPLIQEGMMVEVAHGPLKGVVGRLQRKGSHARLILSVDLIGQAVSVEVDAADVKPY